MWLRLYQSASIWLVLGLSRAPTHRSMVPQVQLGCRPIASSLAPAESRMTAARTQARRDTRKCLAERLRLQPTAVRGTGADMLRTYGPGCDGSLVDPKAEKIPDGATWVDLEEPTEEEEALVERCIRMDVPTESEMAEIEPSSRLYEHEGALYMTVSVLFGVEDGQPTTTPISFVLTDDRLVTVRYATPKPVRAFSEHARRDPELVKDAPTVLVRMLAALIDRLADELENVSRDMEQLSGQIFHKDVDDRRIPAARLTALLTRIGRAQTLLTRTRQSAVSTLRLLS